jgi:hypothetical protein
MSNPRPIHAPYREINETPDTKEPSYSYEESLFRGVPGDDNDDLGDVFHQRLEVASAQTTRRDSGGGGGASNHHHRNDGLDNHNHPRPKIMINAGSFRKSNAPSLLSAVLSDHSSSATKQKQQSNGGLSSTSVQVCVRFSAG